MSSQVSCLSRKQWTTLSIGRRNQLLWRHFHPFSSHYSSYSRQLNEKNSSDSCNSLSITWWRGIDWISSRISDCLSSFSRLEPLSLLRRSVLSYNKTMAIQLAHANHGAAEFERQDVNSRRVLFLAHGCDEFYQPVRVDAHFLPPINAVINFAKEKSTSFDSNDGIHREGKHWITQYCSDRM